MSRLQSNRTPLQDQANLVTYHYSSYTSYNAHVPSTHARAYLYTLYIKLWSCSHETWLYLVVQLCNNVITIQSCTCCWSGVVRLGQLLHWIYIMSFIETPKGEILSQMHVSLVMGVTPRMPNDHYQITVNKFQGWRGWDVCEPEETVCFADGQRVFSVPEWRDSSQGLVGWQI